MRLNRASLLLIIVPMTATQLVLAVKPLSSPTQGSGLAKPCNCVDPEQVSKVSAAHHAVERIEVHVQTHMT